VGVNDKIEHLSAFFILGCLINLMLFFQDGSKFLKKHFNVFTLFFGMLYGALDELHQKLVPGRSCEFNDWLSDSSGILIAICFVFLLRKWFAEKEKPLA
jgi:VanZ family protein